MAPPSPAAEIPELLFMPPAALLRLLHELMDLDALQELGVEYLGKQLPQTTVFRLQGTALFVAQYWEQLKRGASS